MRTRVFCRWLWSTALGLGAAACSIYTPSLLDPGGGGGGGGGSSNSGSGGGGGDAPDASVGGATTGGSAGTGGGSAGTAGSAGGGSGSGGTSGLETEILDDMEDGNGFLFNFMGRNGDWFTGNDNTDGGTQVPLPGMFKMSTRENPDGVSTCVDDCAAYTMGGGFTTWGSVIGANIRGAQMNDAGAYFIPPYDASAYCGVSFSAKIGADATPQIRFVMADKSSFHTGGVCNPNVPLPNLMGCNDHHGISLLLTTEWQTLEVLFSELAQEGSGLQAEFDPANVYTFEFPIFKDTQFELWVDDLVLLKKPQGGTCP